MWNEYLIKDACELLTGFPFKSKFYLDEGPFKVVRGDNIKAGFIKWGNKTRCLSESTKNLNKFLLKENDIVVAMDGNVGKNRACIQNKDLPAFLAQRVACIRAKNNFDQNFIKYIVFSNNFKKYIDSVKTGTTINHISLKQIGEISFKAPDLKTQSKIGNILNNIDKKIEINNQINNNLELIAENVFKNWFVDCEPFNSEKFKETNWANVPFNWEEIKLNDLIDITSGKRPKEKFNHYNHKFKYPLFGASSIMGYVNEYLFDEKILIIGRVGTHGIVQRVNFKSYPSDNTLVITSKFYNFVYQILKLIDYDSLNIGSTQPLLTQKSIKNVEVILPPKEWLNKYEKFCNELFLKIEKNNIESIKLTKLRDILLPKLMAGEIDVSNIKL